MSFKKKLFDYKKTSVQEYFFNLFKAVSYSGKQLTCKVVVDPESIPDDEGGGHKEEDPAEDLNDHVANESELEEMLQNLFFFVADVEAK